MSLHLGSEQENEPSLKMLIFELNIGLSPELDIKSLTW